MANLGSLSQGAQGDLQSNVILQEALDTFVKDLGFFGSIHTDFGGSAVRFNQSLVTRIWAKRATTDVIDFGSAGGGYNGGGEDSDAEAVSITLDKHPFIKFHLTDLEREQSQVSLIADIAQQAAHALARKVAEDLLIEGLAEATTVGAVTPANWGMDDLYTLAKKFDDADMPSEGRWLVMSTQAYYETLAELTNIANASYNINSGISEASFQQRLAGFDIYTYNGLDGLDADSGAATDKSYDLLAGYRGSLAMVSRLPEFADASMQIGDIANASEPSSGISLQLRRKYDVFDAKEEYALTCMYGLKAPNDTVGKRMFRQKIQ
jgi:hypothetical protein